MKTAIFDIDGTIANIEHRVHLAIAKEWDEFHKDLHLDSTNDPVIEICRELKNKGYQIVLMTGRPENYLHRTKYWLNKNGIIPSRIFMRPVGDYTGDVELKRSWLAELRETGYDVVMAFEDRQRVVDMWREEGVFCFQCGPGDF